MQKLNLPLYKFRIKEDKNQTYLFDDLRKKFLLLTPEEWVRQNIIRFLIDEKKTPEGLISIEAGLNVNTLKRRYDALIFSKQGTPLILVECKAPKVKINQKVFEQILAYNSTISAPYMLITNGLQHFFLRRGEKGNFSFVDEIPTFIQLSEDF
jgi:hypothetical protein